MDKFPFAFFICFKIDFIKEIVFKPMLLSYRPVYTAAK
jgi:hypothetical protein